MLITRTLPALREACAALIAAHGSLDLVPTMGALHDGHLALLRAARAGGGAIVVSVFVNPTQFAAHEDLERYPRQESADLAMLEAAGCDLAWLPDVATMYPPADASLIDVRGPALLWEGKQRPGHFRGVATVVAKLLGQTRAARGFFGEKDWQQLQVLRRVAADLHWPADIIAVPTVREADGLALSSRNRFLSAEERRRAPMLYQALQETAARLRPGERTQPACAAARERLDRAGFKVDYFDLVDAVSLLPVATLHETPRLIAAARLGEVRLLDNIDVGHST